MFKTYYDWATPSGATSSTFEKNSALAYSGYTLRFDCDISGTTTKTGSGCCLQDASGQSGDGYCIMQMLDAADSTQKPFTYFLTNS